jgi:hypothetical protein
MIRLAWKYISFVLIFPQGFLNKKAEVKSESAASSGGQGKFRYFG